MESIKYFPGIMSENITLVSKKYAESVFTTGPVIKEITSSDGSVSVFVNGPKVDLKVKSGGGSDDNNLYAFRIYFDRTDSTQLTSAVEYFVNEIIRRLWGVGEGRGTLICTFVEPHIQYFNYSEVFSFESFSGASSEVITVFLNESSPIDKNEFAGWARGSLFPDSEFIELLPKPVYSMY